MISIRQAAISDLNDLTSLFLGYLDFYRRKNVELLREEAYTFLKERLKNKESIILIAHENSELFGFTQLYPLFSSVRMKRTWLLNDLFVTAAHRKMGIASLLIGAAKEHCKKTGYSGLLLETEKDNDRANPLYLKEEFKIIPNNFYFWENL